MKIQIDKSDVMKIYDALLAASVHLRRRDEMNAALHLAHEVRWSPLTSAVDAARIRLQNIMLDHGLEEEMG